MNQQQREEAECNLKKRVSSIFQLAVLNRPDLIRHFDLNQYDGGSDGWLIFLQYHFF